MTVIAMTREMGTRGKQVAALVAERLASRLVYHELVNDPPDTTGPSEVTRHLGNDRDTAAGTSESATGNDRMTPVEVLELASRGNVIIRGWGAARLLRDIPHVLCLRVCAPMEARIAEMMRRLGVSERIARSEIERSDAMHTGMFLRLFGDDWRDAGNYDLVLNTGRTSPEVCAEMVVDAVSSPSFRETPQSRQALADRLAEARIAAFLAAEPHLKGAARGVYVSVSGGTARLFGSVHGEQMAREIARAVRASQCVAQIRDELQISGSYAPY